MWPPPSEALKRTNGIIHFMRLRIKEGDAEIEIEANDMRVFDKLWAIAKGEKTK